MSTLSTLLRPVGCWLERFRPVWVGAVVLGIAWFEGRYLVAGLALVAGLWIVAGLGSGVWLSPSPFVWPWLVWLLMLPVTLWATAHPELTRQALGLFVAQGLAFWVLVVWLRTAQRARWAWAVLVLVALALCALSLFWLQWAGRLFDVPGTVRTLQQGGLPVQETVNRNVMASVLVVLWPLTLVAVALPQGRWRWPGRIAAGAIAASVLAVLTVSQSRGAWLAAAAALFVLLALRWRVLWLGLPLAAVVALLLAWQGGWTPLLTAALQSDALGGLDGRVEVWSRAIYAVQDFAFTGIGMGTFARVVPLLYPYFLHGPDTVIPHAHNLWLQVAVDLGLGGLIAFLSMLLLTGMVAGRSLRALANTGHQDLVWLQRGALAGLTAALVHGVVDAATWNIRPAFLVWAVWGLCAGVSLWALAATRSGHGDLPSA